MGTQLPSPKGAEPPIFGPRLLWPNGCMDQDATWYGCRPRPTRHCVRWGPKLPSLQGHSPQFSANVHCGQTAGWTKMPHGMEVGLDPGDCVRWEPSYPPEKRAHPPLFGPSCLLWLNGWMNEDATWYGSRRRPRHCITRGPSSP